MLRHSMYDLSCGYYFCLCHAPFFCGGVVVVVFFTYLSWHHHLLSVNWIYKMSWLCATLVHIHHQQRTLCSHRALTNNFTGPMSCSCPVHGKHLVDSVAIVIFCSLNSSSFVLRYASFVHCPLLFQLIMQYLRQGISYYMKSLFCFSSSYFAAPI